MEPRTNSKTQSSLNFLQSGPRKLTKSDFSGLAPIWGAANGGLRDGGLSKSEDIWGKRPFSTVFWISQVLFVPPGKGRKRLKKGEKGRFLPISGKGGQTPLKPPFVTPPFAAAQFWKWWPKNSPSEAKAGGAAVTLQNHFPPQAPSLPSRGPKKSSNSKVHPKPSQEFREQIGPFRHKIRVLVRIRTKKFLQSSPKAWEDEFFRILFLAPIFYFLNLVQKEKSLQSGSRFDPHPQRLPIFIRILGGRSESLLRTPGFP